jgi:hypothetical protein
LARKEALQVTAGAVGIEIDGALGVRQRLVVVAKLPVPIGELGVRSSSGPVVSPLFRASAQLIQGLAKLVHLIEIPESAEDPPISSEVVRIDFYRTSGVGESLFELAEF